MFREDALIYIVRGHEEHNVEYKESMPWSDRRAQLDITRAMLAMANHRDGGVIVIGVRETGKNGICVPEGMSEAHFSSFSYDGISKIVRNFADPLIEFKLDMNEAEIGGENRKFGFIQVSESLDPTICVRSEKFNQSADWQPKNIALRANAIYIRSKAPIESREIATVHEWRELIDRCVEKKSSYFTKYAGFVIPPGVVNPTDIERFNKDGDDL